MEKYEKEKYYIPLTAKLLQAHPEVIEALLWEVVYADAVHYDNNGNAYWEACGEPLIPGTNLWEYEE